MEKLIKLAKEKGFISHFNKEWKYNSKEPLRQLFELTELQQWLREVHNIIVEPRYDCDDFAQYGKNTRFEWYCWVFKPMNYESENEPTFDTHELALEQGLLEALKLI